MQALIKRIFQISTEKEFEKLALEVYRFQFRNNPVYRQFNELLGRSPERVKRIKEIPFLPVEMFKHYQVVSTAPPYDAVFESSGTTSMQRSKHYIKDLSLYEKSFMLAFKLFYGNPADFLILALLPSYLERKTSSLVYMMNKLIEQARPGSGFYLHNVEELYTHLMEAEEKQEKILLLGVSFALLDLAERYPMNLKNTIVMETGGMKGRRREPVREELHAYFKERFGVSQIHSEYGMTELMSQAYSYGEGRFRTPPWMKILVRDTEDPLDYLPDEKTGGINIIDLANLYSCSFIATQDLGKMQADKSFEVLGRFDNSDIRGCNLLLLE